MNWAGPLEVAYRALSWMWAYRLTAAEISDEDRLTWLGGFLDHGRFLDRHLKLYASPYNHLVGEASVLYMLGVLFPEFHEASRWRRRGDILEGRLHQQFYRNGGSVEQAIVYHHATLGFYLPAALLGRRNGEEFSAAVWSSIERGIEFAMQLMQPDGHLPAIGDNDDARPILFEWRDTWDFRHFQSIGAVLWSRADFRYAAGRFHEEAVWILGPDGYEQFHALPSVRPPTSKRLGAAGYVVLRSGWDREADYVCFDCGEQAGGLRTDGIASAAHGHADCLAIVAALGGQPLLVDAGFFTYNGNVRYYRETASHNTVLIDGRNQAEHLEKMTWAHVPQATLHASHFEASGGWAVGSHDGYVRYAAGVTHLRAVWLRCGYVIVYDRLHGLGSFAAEWVWQFAPALEALLQDNELLLSSRYRMVWSATAPLTPVLHLEGTDPSQGWIAPHLGVRVGAPRLSLSSRCVDQVESLTVVADLTRWDEVATERGLSSPAVRLVRGQ